MRKRTIGLGCVEIGWDQQVMYIEVPQFGEGAAKGRSLARLRLTRPTHLLSIEQRSMDVTRQQTAIS